MSRTAVTRSLPLAGVIPGRIESMEAASSDLWDSLRRLSVMQLKSLRPTPEYQHLVDALIDIRSLLGD